MSQNEQSLVRRLEQKMQRKTSLPKQKPQEKEDEKDEPIDLWGDGEPSLSKKTQNFKNFSDKSRV